MHLSERRDDTLNHFARMNGLRYTLDELVGTMRRHKIVCGLLLSPPLRGGVPLPNENVIRLCRRGGRMLAPVITVEPTAKEVKAAVKLADEDRKEVKGFKVRLGYVKASADSPVFDRLYDYAEKYAEWLARKISEAIYFAGGADKVIFGTDYPVTKHEDTLALVRRLEVDEGDKEKILWRNAERVFGV